MNRRTFLKILIAGGAGSLMNRSLGQRIPVLLGKGQALPPVQVNTYSSEIVLNSRRSYHGGYSGALSDQILANILWAASRAPVIGANRVIYVARPDNVYTYDPVAHEISLHLAGNHMSEPNCAFEVGVASDLAEDAGGALHYAHLAAHAFWTTTANQPSCCPKESAATNANATWNPALEIKIANCYGFMSSVSGITDELVAVSSNGSLPDPDTDGPIILENALSTLVYGEEFLDTELSLAELSQLAWASYGNTPHTVMGSRAAITVASAVAYYYLTGRIYIVRSEGVERYHIRLPSGQVSTRDHRIERVTDGDRRAQLRAAVTRLPQTAPDYFVYCAATADRWQMIEAGYSAASALLQSASLDLQGHCTADFTTAERTAIINALGIPSTDLPLVIFSAGHVDTGISETDHDTAMRLNAAPNPFAGTTKVQYTLDNASRVMVKIHDRSGRLVKTLMDRTQYAGNHAVVWNGTDDHNAGVPAGIYYVIVKTGLIRRKIKLIKLQSQ
ncbi:MAG: T9SS type A sorting domain-containing protein [candidate division WOR-3 bacterium]|nr:MAG: T9SS type A sorting domain-containing protein [candidate division WOR-3 bacterium]